MRIECTIYICAKPSDYRPEGYEILATSFDPTGSEFMAEYTLLHTIYYDKNMPIEYNPVDGKLRKLRSVEQEQMAHLHITQQAIKDLLALPAPE